MSKKYGSEIDILSESVTKKDAEDKEEGSSTAVIIILILIILLLVGGGVSYYFYKRKKKQGAIAKQQGSGSGTQISGGTGRIVEYENLGADSPNGQPRSSDSNDCSPQQRTPQGPQYPGAGAGNSPHGVAPGTYLGGPAGPPGPKGPSPPGGGQPPYLNAYPPPANASPYPNQNGPPRRS